MKKKMSMYEKVGIWLEKVFAFFEECDNFSSIICVFILYIARKVSNFQ